MRLNTTEKKNWKQLNIPEVVFFQEGPGVRNTQFRSSGVKLLNVGNINDGKIILSSTKTHLSEEEAYGKYSHFLVEEGDLLIACSGIVVENFHNKIAFATNEHLPLCLNTSTMRFRVLDSEILDIVFFKYFLQSRIFKEQLVKLITGSAQLNFGPSHIKKSKIPLPPIDQQKKIASILDAADAYRQKTKALIAKYDELTQSLFLDMFGDPVSNPKGWEKVKLGNVTNMKAGKFISASEISSETGKDFFVCFGGNGIRGYVKSYTHDGSFVLIGRQGALCGNVKTVKGKFHATEHAIVCSPKMKYETLWLYYLLKILDLNRFATGAAQPGLNVGTLIDLDIIFAPFRLQNQFAERVQAIEQQKSQAQASLEKAEELFNSLLQKAFRGELV